MKISMKKTRRLWAATKTYREAIAKKNAGRSTDQDERLADRAYSQLLGIAAEGPAPVMRYVGKVVSAASGGNTGPARVTEADIDAIAKIIDVAVYSEDERERAEAIDFLYAIPELREFVMGLD